jgi:hypothetical protein
MGNSAHCRKVWEKHVEENPEYANASCSSDGSDDDYDTSNGNTRGQQGGMTGAMAVDGQGEVGAVLGEEAGEDDETDMNAEEGRETDKIR